MGTTVVPLRALFLWVLAACLYAYAELGITLFQQSWREARAPPALNSWALVEFKTHIPEPLYPLHCATGQRNEQPNSYCDKQGPPDGYRAMWRPHSIHSSAQLDETRGLRPSTSRVTNTNAVSSPEVVL